MPDHIEFCGNSSFIAENPAPRIALALSILVLGLTATSFSSVGLYSDQVSNAYSSFEAGALRSAENVRSKLYQPLHGEFLSDSVDTERNSRCP